MSNQNEIELLTPLKNFKSLNAILDVADAVYFGIESMNMRIFADNIKLKDLDKLVRICHDNNIKAY
ncbi:MAG: hypothetical protein ACTSUL_00480 [Promethearchaeota archaeon]